MIKPGAAVIDVGINRVNGELIGDVNAKEAAEKAEAAVDAGAEKAADTASAAAEKTADTASAAAERAQAAAHTPAARQ